MKKLYDVRIEDTAVLTENYEVKEHVTILIKNGLIAEILEEGEGDGKTDPDSRNTDAGEVIRAPGKLWIPGLTDGHMHTGQQLLKGKILDELPMIWTRIMLPFESTLTPEKMKLSAELAALEMMMCGTTSFVDAGSYFMEEAAEVYLASGLRGALSCSTMDDPGLPDAIRMNAKEAVSETDRLYDRFHGKGGLKVYYSLRSLISCSRELMALAAERAKERDTMLQAHMNEYPNEVNFFLQNYRKRPLEFLESEGILDERFISAHSLLLSEEEMDLMKERKVKVVHCPFSNCGKAVPDTPALLGRGITVGLGTDGTAHGGMSLFHEMKIFRSVMNAVYGTRLAKPDIMPAKQILKMVFEGGAEIMNEGGRLGQLKKGCLADLVSVNMMEPHLYPTGNPVNTLVECVGAGDVKDMIVNGKVLMREREIRTLDKERILYEAARI